MAPSSAAALEVRRLKALRVGKNSHLRHPQLGPLQARVSLEEERRRLLPILLQLFGVPSIATNSCNPSPSTDTTISCSRTAVSCSRTVVECINPVE